MYWERRCINVDRIENKELRDFIERNPDASFRDVVEFCKQKFDDAIAELSSSDTRRLQEELNNDELHNSPRELSDIIQPFVKHNVHCPYYNRLQDKAILLARKIMRDIDALGSSHSEEFISSLKRVVYREFDDISTITPSPRIDLSSIYKDTNKSMQAKKEEQDYSDRRKTDNISRHTSNEQEGIMKEFIELSAAEQQNYGITFERGRGTVRIQRVFDGVKAKLEQLSVLFKSTRNFLNDDVAYTLTHDNARILEQVQTTVRECRGIMDEAVYQISKEQIEEELCREDQRREDIKRKLEEEDRELEARRAERRREEEQYMQRAQERKEAQIFSDNPFDLKEANEDLSALFFKFDKDIVLIDPSPETYQKLMGEGMPEEDVPKYIWDGFVRTSDIDKKLKKGEITQEVYEQELVKIQKIEGILFDEIVAGVDFETARSTAENVVEHGQEYTPTPKATDEFSYSLDDILISASDETRAILIKAGLPESQVDAFIWDGFVRKSNLDSDLKSGKITQYQYAKQAGLIDRIEEVLFDGLVEGKSIDVARVVAEKMAAYEENVTIAPSPECQKKLEEAGLSSEDAKRYVWDGYARTQIINEIHARGLITEEEKAEQLAKVDEIEAKLVEGLKAGKSFEEARKNAEVSSRKSARQDIAENGNITIGQVQKANSFIQLEANPQSKDDRRTLGVDLIY